MSCMKKVVRLITPVISFFQVILLHIAYFTCKRFVIKSDSPQWIIGVDEIAGMLHQFSKVLKPCKTVCLRKNKFYSYTYDYELNTANRYLLHVIRLFYGPVLLGRLAAGAPGFFYIWQTGFLFDRAVEFKFLKSKKKKIICFFCGDDIRSPVRLHDFCKKLELDSFVEYVGWRDPVYLSPGYDADKKNIARTADRYADIIFNAPVDQLSYITRPQEPFFYIYDKENIVFDDDKFSELKKIKVIHAPSNPVVKGTPLVRAAVKKLKIEGYRFEYVELQNQPHEAVLEHLDSAHIVLNEFYALMPGVFGIEGMAHHCAVLTSADPDLETCLPADGKEAWMVTMHWEVYDNLKELLDHPEKIKEYADRGRSFVQTHYTVEAAEERMKKILSESDIAWERS